MGRHPLAALLRDFTDGSDFGLAHHRLIRPRMRNELIAGRIDLAEIPPAHCPGDPGEVSSFTVQRRDDLSSLSERLEEEGFVSDAEVFRWYVERDGGLEIVPGYYELRPNDHTCFLPLQ